ncbi:MAG: pilus assembly protein PilM [Deltaproteobacteria bacterium]|nr:pilus assembly protein PilM [Deltaproteobacteria bacterium]
MPISGWLRSNSFPTKNGNYWISNADLSEETPEFDDFLKSSLTKFCGPLKEFKIWSIMSAVRADIRYFLIPKAAKKQIEKTVYWKLKKEADFDEEESIFDFRVQDEVVEKGVAKIVVIAYAAPKKEVEKTKNLFSKIGFPLAGISIAPFAIQNLLKTGWISASDQTVTNLHIAHDWSRINIFFKGNLVMTRGIKTGVNSMVESLMERFNKSEKAFSLEVTEPEEIPLTVGFDAEVMNIGQAQKVLFSLNPDSTPLTEKDIGFHLKKEEILEMISPAVDRLVRQVERTFKYYATTFKVEGVGKIYNSGGVHFYGALVDYIGEKLGFDMEINDPFDPAKNPFLGAVTPPESVSDRALFALAAGMALSDNIRTPNFIFTYKDKKKHAGITRIKQCVFVAFILTIAVSVGFFWWLASSGEQKKAELARLDQQLSQYTPRMNKDSILQVSARLKKKYKRLKEYSEKLLVNVAIGELAAMTPSNIRLLSITADLGRVSANKGMDTEKRLVVDGIILGEKEMFETFLVGYMMRLGSSPVFSAPVVNKGAIKSYGKEGDALHFTIELKLV